MGYNIDNLTKDFFTRTLTNLVQYLHNQKKKPNNYKQEVTMIINSLLGILVFVQQSTLNKKSFRKKLNLGTIIQKSDCPENQKNSFHFLRHMRNSIAHNQCLEDFKVDNNNQITHLTFKDNYEEDTFKVELSILEMIQIINSLKKAMNITVLYK